MSFKAYILLVIVFSLFFFYFVTVSDLHKVYFHKYKVDNVINCVDNTVIQKTERRGNFLVLYNYVLPTVTYKCNEAITYATHGDYSFLDNLETLVDRWDNPVSLAIYAPGDDFEISLKSIAYLRNCKSTNIKKYVTFHVFFHDAHFPTEEGIIYSYDDFFNCTEPAPYEISKFDSYVYNNYLTYPINVARNIARVTAQTHFVFSSDIELYPVRNFSRRFLDMISTNPQYLSPDNPNVFVIPVFEITERSEVPSNKTVLQTMLKNDTAQLFHKKLCKFCHDIPQMQDWIELDESEGFHVFTVANRKREHAFWEPFYVGTQKEPLFDERLTWQGQKNKMTQAFSMCLLGYNYMVLDNAFLIHKPGIKLSKYQVTNYHHLVVETNLFVRNIIKPELRKLYGRESGCIL